MQTTEKLTTLREKLRDAGMDGYVVTTGDFHGSEYVGSFFKTRAWLSGFTGSAGTLVVLPDRAALWTDGRYFLQAGQQLAGSTIELMREGQPGVPSVADFLAEHLPRGGTLGFDGRTVSAAFARGLEKALAPREIRFAADRDLVGEIWADRPALSAEPVWELDAALAGAHARGKARAAAPRHGRAGRGHAPAHRARRDRVDTEPPRRRRRVHTGVSELPANRAGARRALRPTADSFTRD